MILPQRPPPFFQFLYNIKINFLQILLMGEDFPALFFLPLAAVVAEERF